VALKEVRIPVGVPRGDPDRAQQRVYREARAAARLNHPGAVAVYDVISEDGAVYIVMELVEAPTLDELVREWGSLPPSRVADIGLRLLDVLTAAHARSIVHRDIKPTNVMVADDGSVKLADFGVAALTDEPRMTTGGATVGSPAFMAPEQAQGGPVGPATDLWALGATMYYAVEGWPPFERGQSIATLTAVVNDDVPPPRRAGPLRPVIMGLLQKDPNARLSAYDLRVLLERSIRLSDGASTAELAPASGRFQGRGLDEQPARSPDAPAGRHLTPPPRRSTRRARHGRALAIVAVLTFLALVGALVALSPWRSDRVAGSEARHSTVPSPSPPGARPSTGVAGPPASPAPSATSPPAEPSTQASSPPSPVPSPPSQSGQPGASPQVSTGPGSPAAPGVPAGWTVYRDASVGWEIAHPEGWEAIPRNSHTIDFRDPGTGAYMRVAWTDEPGPDPQARWEEYSRSFAASHEAYHEIKIDSTTFHGMKASNWEFTFVDGGAELHANDLGFVNTEWGFALFFQTPVDSWESFQDDRRAFEDSFEAPS
jgi:serine/threonine protein kinase